MKFRGYGNPKGPLWFLGIEEKLGKRPGRMKEFMMRTSFHDVMDLGDAQALLGREVRNAKTPTWTWMSKFARSLLQDSRDWKDLDKAKDYRNRYLGRTGGDTFLTELFPIPARSTKKKDVPWPKLSRNEYEKQVLSGRKELLLKMLKRHRPRYVVAYAKPKHLMELLERKLKAPRARIDKDISGYTLGNTRVVLISFCRG